MNGNGFSSSSRKKPAIEIGNPSPSPASSSEQQTDDRHSTATPAGDELGRIFAVSTLDTAIHSLQSIVQFHFDKTIQKKRGIDAQKKQLWALLAAFLVFLALLFASVAATPPGRLQCRHCWSPIALASLGHAVIYAAVSQTVRVLNGLKFQRHCHKLTLGLAAAKLAKLRALPRSLVATVEDCEFEVPYQEPVASYYAKFTRRWAVYAAFLLLTLATMVASTVTILCL
ncbi:hypothetical protein SELMODRAFT_113732 [Selaginella moellendorffii]|uniref:Uncharacterized protein n=1 Tax=Selaginella moellendorffii TaxID=88036 RepID=D8SCI0_SELML|nr:hypothetical protein SELMODRAFT_116827 [Selaginella moellendorffii]EFJ17716.1 hypothetical protein SELMODRAFT_113732 [Selaginella moellendorffii]